MLVRYKFVTIGLNMYNKRVVGHCLMNIIVKNTLILFLIFCGMTNYCYAFDLDSTVDDEIRKNYNDTKLINDVGISNKALDKKIKTKATTDESLPALPNITKQPASSKKSDIKSNNTIKPPQTYIPYRGGNIRVHKGTSFEVANNSAISDWQSKGTNVKFTVKNPIKTRNYTIPAWTSFNGEIIESHQPQISCNGGLVAIKVYSMIYKGQSIPINGYITRANDKKVFFNDIKGERKYWKTVWKKGNWGRALFNRMLTLTINLGGDASTLILSPFPLLYGSICLGFNTLTSPITAFFQKGGHVSIPAGSKFKIKLLEDIYIN